MELIMQPTFATCGQACIAMIYSFWKVIAV